MHCVSKLKTRISLSTLEVEYIALYKDMCNLLPLRQVIQDVGTQFKMEFTSPSIMNCTVFEENNGNLGLATSLRKTQRMHHIPVTHHFYREHVGEGKVIMIQRV